MGIGAIVSNSGSAPAERGIAAMASAAERAGASSVWVSDHLLMVDEATTGYPYSDDGLPTWELDSDYYEALACVGAMAAATDRVRVGTAVLVLPQRNVLEVAKAAATLDQLSGGRLSLGVGAGWNASEFAALGQGFESRGRRFDEMLDVLHACWSGRPPAFEGAELEVPPGVVLSPPPAQPDGVPLLVGGMTKPARRRAATRGDGWLAIAFAEQWDGAELRRRFRDVAERRAQARPGRPFEMVLLLHGGEAMSGRVPALVAEAREIGFEEVIVEPQWDAGLDSACELIEEVVAAAGDGGTDFRSAISSSDTTSS
ncbi:MAG: TIGR03619 family F420-dependent LLM class oxidoreductase [Actinobacteria bacterium]|nr:TIGR03619 family F420-dependent LLM class oxidoreductase [Actinomycetota bacterium]